MLNRFANCKTLKDLYTRFNDDTREYSNVSVAELEAIAETFKANVEEREMPDVPLTDKGYTYIWNYVVDTVEQEERDMMNNNSNETINNATVKENNVMPNVKENVNAAVEDLMTKFKEAKDNVKVQAGETKEEFIERTDESLTIMKEALGDTLDALDTVLGYSVLKNSILEMMEASMSNGSSKKDLFRMARKCRELIEDEIDNLQFWGDEESLKKAVQLQSLTTGVRDKSIFEAFVVGVIWIAKKVARKLRQWFKVDEEKSIIGSICRGIGTFAKLLHAGVKIVWNAVKFAASFIISGVVIVTDWLIHAIKVVVEKIKTWSKDKFTKADDCEELDEDEEIEAEIVSEGDGVFGTNLA